MTGVIVDFENKKEFFKDFEELSDCGKSPFGEIGKDFIFFMKHPYSAQEHCQFVRPLYLIFFCREIKSLAEKVLSK